MGRVAAWRMAIRRPKEYRYTAHPHPSKMDARLGESYQQVPSQRESPMDGNWWVLDCNIMEATIWLYPGCWVSTLNTTLPETAKLPQP